MLIKIRSTAAGLALAAVVASTANAFAGIPAAYTGANGSWNTAANWSSSPVVPLNAGPNTYDVAITSKSVTYNVAGSNAIDSLTLSSATLSLSAGDNLSVLNASSWSHSTLNANTAAFSAANLTNIDSSSLSANSGAITLAGLAAYSTASNTTFSATGATGQLLLNALASVNLQSAQLTLSASSGGDLEAPNFATLSTTQGTEVLTLRATDANTLLDVQSLGALALNHIAVTMTTGATINWGNPTSFQSSSMTLNGGGTISTSALANINSSSFTIQNGAALNLALVTSYTSSTSTTFTASGANAKLQLNNLTSINLQNTSFSLQALSGGELDLNSLTSFTSTNSNTLTITATGAGSVINIPQFGLAAISHVNVSMNAGATLNWGAPTAVQNSTLNLNGGGTLNTSALANIDSTTLTIQTGATLSLPLVTSYTNSTSTNFTATGASSKLQLNNLTVINLQSSSFTLQAQSGGELDLNALASVSSPNGKSLTLTASGAGSVLNVPALGNSPLTLVSVNVSTGGTLNWGAPTSLQSSSITLSGATTLNTSAISTYNDSSLNLSNAAAISLPALQAITIIAYGSNFQATGAATTINLGGLTTLHFQGEGFTLNAQSGGTLNAPVLSTLTYSGSSFESLSLTSSGTNSLLSLPHLGDSPQLHLNVNVSTGGTINWGTPTNIQQSTLSLDTSGTLNTSAISNFNDSGLSASNGATIALPALQTITVTNWGYSYQASGTGSTTNLAALNTIHFNGENFTFSAQSGGAVNAPVLSALAYSGSVFENLSLNSSGAGSLISIPHLGDSPQLHLNVSVAAGGAINWGSPTNIQQSTISLDTAGTLNTSALTVIDATSLASSNGAVLTLPALTKYGANAFINIISFNASSTGTINLPALTTINFDGNGMSMNVSSGGIVNAPILNSLTYTGSIFENLALSATGLNSTINMPHFGDSPKLHVNASLSAGGTINWGNPTVLQQSSISITTAGTINLATLTNIDATSLTASTGATLTLPSVTAYTTNPFLNILSFNAQNASSKISLPALDTLHLVGNDISITAQSGGAIDLHSLSNVTNSGSVFDSVSVTARNSGSLADFSSLLSTLSFTNSFTVADNAQLLMGKPGGSFSLAFTADFTNSIGTLDVYVGNMLLASIMPNHISTNEPYQYAVSSSYAPTSANIRFVANGANSNIVLSKYSAMGPTWNTSNGNWSNAANWAVGSPNGPGAAAAFNGSGAPAAVNVDSPQTIGSIYFSGSSPFSLNTNALTLDNTGSAGDALIYSASAQTQTINSPIIVSNTNLDIKSLGGGALALAGGLTNPAGKTVTLAATNASSISIGPINNNGTIIANAGNILLNANATGSGTFVLAGGTLSGNGSLPGLLDASSGTQTIYPGAPAATLAFGSLKTNPNTTLAFDLFSPASHDQITITSASGLTLNGGTIQIPNTSTGAASLGYYKIIQYAGAIQGAGISSLTLPPTANNISYTLDTAHDPGFIDIHRGFLGDANDDGLVNFSDFVLLSNHFSKPNQGWAGGDFNGDGITNFSDFVILSNHFGNSATGANELSAADIAAFQSETANFAAPTPVPEPASLAILALGSAAFLKRTKNRYR